MKRALILAILASTPHDDRVPVGSANLYARDVGRGQPIVVLHGGPHFDDSYLLPDMDRLARGTAARRSTRSISLPSSPGTS